MSGLLQLVQNVVAQAAQATAVATMQQMGPMICALQREMERSRNAALANTMVVKHLTSQQQKVQASVREGFSAVAQGLVSSSSVTSSSLVVRKVADAAGEVSKAAQQAERAKKREEERVLQEEEGYLSVLGTVDAPGMSDPAMDIVPGKGPHMQWAAWNGSWKTTSGGHTSKGLVEYVLL
jgi:hypothetical protein